MAQEQTTSDIEKMRHSFAHVLAMAVLEIFPDVKLGIGPAIDNGFYYDFDLSRKLTAEDIPEIEEHMKKIISQDLQFQQIFLPREEAIDSLNQRGQVYKTELLNEIPDEEVSFYKTGEDFIDMCRGPHVNSTKDLKAFKIMSIAGAYWRGDEKRPQLQRIYGAAFNTQKELDEHLELLEELKKRDHRKLGKELQLFTTDPEAGQGLIMWLPKGAQIRRLMEDFQYKEQVALGYHHVYSPHIANIQLYKRSGHWDHYRDDMYSSMIIDDDEYVLKPMNCPHHIKMYASDLRSYRDLPYKIAEFATVYRYEKSGEISGLSRTRGFTQDDAHIFCSEDQIREEVKEAIQLTQKLLEAYGFDNYRVRLSLHDPEKKEKYIDKPELWERAEQELKDTLADLKMTYVEGTGEAAFYGPKVDFLVKDALGREEQCGTVQLDFNLPERFEISYTDEEGKQQVPVLIHRAPLGSFERFFSRMIEHTNGAFPVWLSPTQVVIIPINDTHADYAAEVKKKLNAKDIRVNIDSRTETMQAKIRDAELDRIPYMLIVGDKEVTNKGVSVRPRHGNDLGLMNMDEFVTRITNEIKDYH